MIVASMQKKTFKTLRESKNILEFVSLGLIHLVFVLFRGIGAHFYQSMMKVQAPIILKRQVVIK